MFHSNCLCQVEFDKQQIKKAEAKTQWVNSETKATSKRARIHPMYRTSITDPTKHRKGATKDFTARYDKGPDNPKPNPNLTLTLI